MTAWLALALGEAGVARDLLVTPAVPGADPGQSPWSRTSRHTATAETHAVLGELAAMEVEIRRALAVTGQHEAPGLRALALRCSVRARWIAGQAAEALAEVQPWLDLELDRGDAGGAAYATGLRGVLRAELGRYEEARADLDTGLESASGWDAVGRKAIFTAYSGFALARTGYPERGVELLTEAVGLAGRSDDCTLRWRSRQLLAGVLEGQGALAAAHGFRAEADRLVAVVRASHPGA